MANLILGINILGHDSSVALVNGETGKVLYCLNEERFSNEKHDARFPVACLTELNQIIQRENLGQICWVGINFIQNYWIERALFSALREDIQDQRILKKLEKAILETFPQTIVFELDFYPLTYIRALLEEEGLEPELIQKIIWRITWHGNVAVLRRNLILLCKEKFPHAEFIEVSHHNCHAASAYFASGFKDAAILTLDGRGEWETLTLQCGRQGRLKTFSFSSGIHSLGLFYEMLTYFLGFSNFGEEYKVMGMAAYGKPIYIDFFRSLATVDDQGVFQFKNFELLTLTHEPSRPGSLFLMISQKFSELLGGPRKKGEEITQRHFDIAASLQLWLEEIGVLLATKLKKLCPDLDQLCIAGGVGLNGLMNMQIYKNSGFKEIYIHPASGDDGTALGAAYFILSQVLNRIPEEPLKNAFCGLVYSCEDVAAALKDTQAVYSKPLSIHKKIAELLAEGKIVSRFHGRSEHGPRALGHRSILANPSSQEMKDILNARIKHREQFRPFAPACLLEQASEFFDIDCATEYMLLICKVREDKKHLIPAVVHEDGTARLQTVSKKSNEDLYFILKEFCALTGIPVLMNTSFNVNREAMVETPRDAIDCFLYTDIDYLALEDNLLEKSKNKHLELNISLEDFLEKRKKRYRTKYFGHELFIASNQELGVTNYKAAKYDSIYQDWIAKEKVIQGLSRELRRLHNLGP